jgi:sulfur-oxidizing protein SoxZ
MAGTIKARAQVEGGTTVVKALISHPMETGQRKDKKTGKLIPAHFIQELNVDHNGKNVLNAAWGPAISKNPYLFFKFKGAKAGDKIKISWSDNMGEHDSAEFSIKS